MFSKIAKSPFKIPILLLIVVSLLILIIAVWYRGYISKQKEPYKIGVIINSVEIAPEDLEVVKFIIAEKIESINEEGGIDGHPVEPLYIDDKGINELLVKLVGESIPDTNLIAYIGCNRSSQINAIKELGGNT